jgi:phosphoenolpyruvate carboxylase
VILATIWTRCTRWAPTVRVDLLVGASDALQALAASPDHRRTARRALPPRADRHLRAPGRDARALAGTEPCAAPAAARRRAPAPYADRSVLADLQVLTARSQPSRRGAGRAAPAPLMRAAGVRLPPGHMDLRQSSDVHEPWSPSCSRAPACSRLRGAAEDAKRSRCWPRSPAAPAALAVRLLGAAQRTGHLRAAREVRARYGRARCATTSSRTPRRSDLLEVLLLQKETGLLRGARRAHDGAQRPDGDPAVRDHPDLRNAARIMRAASRCPASRR